MVEVLGLWEEVESVRAESKLAPEGVILTNAPDGGAVER
jgi:hypothetical protein